jgi:hypothetical protein
MVVVGNNAKEDSQDGELGLDDQQLGIQLEGKASPMGLALKKNPRAIQMMRPLRVMASKMTSRWKRKQLNKKLPRSPQALLARGYSVLIEGEGQTTREAAGRPGSWEDEAK